MALQDLTIRLSVEDMKDYLDCIGLTEEKLETENDSYMLAFDLAGASYKCFPGLRNCNKLLEYYLDKKDLVNNPAFRQEAIIEAIVETLAAK